MSPGLTHLPRLQDLLALVQRRAEAERFQFGGCRHVLPRYAYRAELFSENNRLPEQDA